MGPIKQLYFGFLSRIKLLQWNFSYNEEKVYPLYILPDFKSKFYMFGDIVKIFFRTQKRVAISKSFEHETLELYRKLINEGDIVLDVGANIGLFSLLGSNAVGDNGTVYAFEPVSKTFEFLKRNLALNQINNVRPYQVAFSDRKTKVSILLDKSKSNSGDALSRINIDGSGKLGTFEEIETGTLDEFAQTNNIKSIDLIKVDIEGAELLFFKGGKETLIKCQPKIIFECSETLIGDLGSSVYDCLHFLSQIGYSVRQYSYGQWLATVE